MPPIRSAIGLPPRASDRVGAHAEPHAELEDAGEQARRRQPHDQALQDTEPGIDLHDPDQPDNRVRRHEAVGIERDRELVAASPALAEFADIAGLEAGIHGTAPVADRDPIAPACDQFGKERLLPDRKIGIAGIAEEVEMEALAVAGSVDTLEHRLEVADDTERQLVANAKQDRRRRRHGLVIPDQPGRRQHRQPPDRRKSA